MILVSIHRENHDLNELPSKRNGTEHFVMPTILLQMNIMIFIIEYLPRGGEEKEKTGMSWTMRIC